MLKGSKLKGARTHRKCRVKTCGEMVGAKGAHGLCCSHYGRWRRGVPLGLPARKVWNAGPCAAGNCARRVVCKKLCAFHYNRKLGGIAFDHAFKKRRNRKLRQKAPGGYMYAIVDGKKVMEHRHIMAQRLGRPLFDHETVHHLNGQRADNRDENLELWSHSQPYGQRVADKLKWAREFISQYTSLERIT